jgi:uncharacterized membrane protein
MKPIAIRIIVFISLLIWTAGFITPLFLEKGYSAFSGLLLSHIYSPVCHQLPHKSITTSSGSFLVCARCSGIYFGALAASFILLFRAELKIKYFLVPLIIMLADVFLNNIGLYGYSKTTALGTGLLVGFALFPYILTTLEKSK